MYDIRRTSALNYRIVGSSWVAAAISSNMWTVLWSVYVTMVTATPRPWCSRPAGLSVRRVGHTARVDKADPSPAGQRYCRHRGDRRQRRDPSAAAPGSLPADTSAGRYSSNAGRRRPPFHRFFAVWWPGLDRQQDACHRTVIAPSLSRDAKDSVAGWICPSALTETATVWT